MMYVGLAVLLVVSVGWAALLRWARCPGWPVLGGAVAGLMLGAGVLGRVAPGVHEALFVGGAAARAELDQLRSRQGADRLAAEQAGVDPAALDVSLQAELDEALNVHQRGRWRDQRPLRVFTGALVLLVLLGSGAFRVAGPRPSGGSALTIGAWAAVLPGALAFSAMWGWFDATPAQALLVGAAVAIGPWFLPAEDQRTADAAEAGGARLVETAGRAASLVAIVFAAAAILALRGGRGLPWALMMVALPVGWHVAPRGPTTRAALLLIAVPALAACAAVHADLLAHFALWPTLVLLVLAGDGRLLGALTGARLLGGRHSVRSTRLLLGIIAVGPTQIALTAIAAVTWALEPTAILALLLGAVLIEAMAPLRRVLADRLATIEHEQKRSRAP